MRKMRIILASASPRRRELLAQIGMEFEVMVSNVEERVTATLPAEVVQELSVQKAEAVLAMLRAGEDNVGKDVAGDDGTDAPALVIGADTIVACDDEILGKPADEADAKRMLRLLSGRSHEVYTGVTMLLCPCLSAGDFVRRHTFFECTKVCFAPMTEAELAEYVATGDPMDKAGAYGIQGFCARYIKGIKGDYNNVVGLPVGRLYQELKEWLGNEESSDI
ncbi:MAG: Maf family protein [Muribaculum sp.]|nr:Maf family protein [Muribaculum sp.]